jgi:hypothetical protein
MLVRTAQQALCVLRLSPRRAAHLLPLAGGCGSARRIQANATELDGLPWALLPVVLPMAHQITPLQVLRPTA